MRENWYLDERVYYYMQMVIPNIFSIDNIGWCASASYWPIKPDNNFKNYNVYHEMKKRILNNVSKFTQPDIENLRLPEKYIFFPCQIPHDETIQYHSDVSVEDSLEAILESLHHFSEYSVVIKGHPANTISMKPFRDIYERYKETLPAVLSEKILWLDNCSVHKLISDSSAVFTVNSGVGFESLLHHKHVYTFGLADYAHASHKIIYGGSKECFNSNIKNSQVTKFKMSKTYSSSMC